MKSSKTTPVREMLRNIAALAERGADGERENAQALLEKLCRKHGIDPGELLDDSVTHPTEFKLKGDDRKLLVQIVVMICATHEVRNYIKGTRAVFWLTASQAVDVHEAFDHYREAWETYRGEALQAFIHGNRLFAPMTDDDEESPPLTPAELARIKRIANMAIFARVDRPTKSLPNNET